MDEQILTQRKCLRCNKEQLLIEFHLKSNGKDGRDSRCKTCIIKLKKTSRRLKKARSRNITVFHSNVAGSADKEAIEQFSEVIAIGIRDLLEKGFLK